jgi:hypothetical protein
MLNGDMSNRDAYSDGGNDHRPQRRPAWFSADGDFVGYTAPRPAGIAAPRHYLGNRQGRRSHASLDNRYQSRYHHGNEKTFG